MTPAQIKNIHVAKNRIGMSDALYKIALHNVAHVTTSKDLTLQGYEDMMALMEDHGWRQCQPRSEPDAPLQFYPVTYWRDIVARRGTFANGRLLHKITELYELYARDPEHYSLGSLARTASSGRTDAPAKLSPREAHNLVELLKDKIAQAPRQSGTEALRPEVVPTPSSAVPEPEPSDALPF